MSKAWKPLLALVLLLATASPAAAETITLDEDGFDPSNAIVEAGETVHVESEAGRSGASSPTAARSTRASSRRPPASPWAPSVPGTHVYRTLGSGKVVARPLIGPDGRFAATAPMPRGKLRHSNKARYDATVAGERSPALKLERRMQVAKVRAAGGKVTIEGRVLGPLAQRAEDGTIEVQRRRSCSSIEVVARVKPAKDGRFRVTLDVPEGERAAVYRLRARVRRSAASPRLFDTFTLPRAVDL